MLIKVYGRSWSFFFPGVAYRVVFLVKQNNDHNENIIHMDTDQ